MDQRNQLFVPAAAVRQAAWVAHENRAIDAAGIADHISFTVMRRLGISKAFTRPSQLFKLPGEENVLLPDS